MLQTTIQAAHPSQPIRPVTAVDIYAALCNIDVYTTLTAERSWPPDRIERWWSEALARELLNQPE